MLTTNGNIIRLIDAFTGQLKHTLSVIYTKETSTGENNILFFFFRVLQIQKICRLKLRLVQMLNLFFVVS
jgi:hypothetical protein